MTLKFSDESENLSIGAIINPRNPDKGIENPNCLIQRQKFEELLRNFQGIQ